MAGYDTDWNRSGAGDFGKLYFGRFLPPGAFGNTCVLIHNVRLHSGLFNPTNLGRETAVGNRGEFSAFRGTARSVRNGDPAHFPGSVRDCEFEIVWTGQRGSGRGVAVVGREVSDDCLEAHVFVGDESGVDRLHDSE